MQCLVGGQLHTSAGGYWVFLASFTEKSIPFSLNGFGTLVKDSVQFSRSVVSDSLRPHESPHARPPCPSPSPGVHSDSRPSSPWCHPAISSWVVPLSSCPQSLPASESFPMSQLLSIGNAERTSRFTALALGWQGEMTACVPYWNCKQTKDSHFPFTCNWGCRPDSASRFLNPDPLRISIVVINFCWGLGGALY